MIVKIVSKWLWQLRTVHSTFALAELSEAMIERFKQGCRAKFDYMRGPGQYQVVHAQISACVPAYAHPILARLRGQVCIRYLNW
jgi:hypothetical protein